MTRALSVPAPAKLNLFLHVTGRRQDGYHTIESLMVLLDFGDTLTLSPRDDGAIVLAQPQPGVPVESDLVFRAATLLQAEAPEEMRGRVFSAFHAAVMAAGPIGLFVAGAVMERSGPLPVMFAVAAMCTAATVLAWLTPAARNA